MARTRYARRCCPRDIQLSARGRAVHPHLCDGTAHAQPFGQCPGLREPLPALAEWCQGVLVSALNVRPQLRHL